MNEPPDPHDVNLPAERPNLPAVALLFLRLGFTAFGGPAAHIAMMQAEVVERRRWISSEEFLDLLGTANLIPGPSSTELAILIGSRLAGTAGLLLAGACFILPAFLIVLALAWAYLRFGSLHQIGSALYGVKPVVIAIVAQAIWNLSRTAVKNWATLALALGALLTACLGANSLLLLLGSGILMGGERWLRERQTANLSPLIAFIVLVALFAAAPLIFIGRGGESTRFGLIALFCLFMKIGSVVYGSGYVLLTFLRADFVIQRGWLTQTQLLDAVAIGQVTPGPVFTTATFIGFVLGGVPGAFIATAGIFLPAFLFVLFTGQVAGRLRSSPIAGAFLDGVSIAALALMVMVTVQLGRAALIDPITIILCIAGLVALVKFCIDSPWLIGAGILVGVVSRG